MCTHARLRGSTFLATALLVALGAWACDEQPTQPADGPAAVEPAFHEDVDDGDKHVDEGDEHKKAPLWMTGGGRVDVPPGDGSMNTPESTDFQTFGFNVGDKDGDGTVEGEFQWVDHREEMRRDGSPLNLHSVSWDSFTPVESACEGGGGDGSAEATGTLEVKNTGDRVPFRLRLDDCGEPGNQSPHDIIEIDAPDYNVRALLSGGNIQAHFRGEQR